MGIFSKSLNLLSKSMSKFTSLPIFSNVSGDMKRRYKLNYLISRRHEGQVHHTRIFSDDQQHLHYEDLDYPNTMRTSHFFPYASCNSLLLAYRNDCSLSSALWNPTTDEVKALPDSSAPKKLHHINYGFGFDLASQDYKVVRFIRLFREGYIQVELYSLKSDSWKEITCANFPDIRILSQPSLDINGFIYWATSKFILSFDLANEKLSRIPLPKTYKLSDKHPTYFIAEFDGSLAVVVYTYAKNTTNEGKHLDIEIWVFKDEAWARVVVSEIIDPVHVLMSVGLFNNDEFYFQDSDGRLFLFHCAKRELKNLDLEADKFEVSVLPYVKSVMSIKGSECRSGRL